MNCYHKPGYNLFQDYDACKQDQRLFYNLVKIHQYFYYAYREIRKRFMISYCDSLVFCT